MLLGLHNTLQNELQEVQRALSRDDAKITALELKVEEGKERRARCEQDFEAPCTYILAFRGTQSIM